jgi:hypothetical protein
MMRSWLSLFHEVAELIPSTKLGDSELRQLAQTARVFFQHNVLIRSFKMNRHTLFRISIFVECSSRFGAINRQPQSQQARCISATAFAC